MYLIDIVLKLDEISPEQSDELLAQHRAWFKQYFEQGKFLMLGPYRDQAGAGVIIAQTDSRAELDAILAEDVYWADKLAVYQIREFQANLIAQSLPELAGK